MLARALTAILLGAVLGIGAAQGQRPVKSSNIEIKVSALIKEALVERTEARAFQQLEELGCAAVPAIVKHLNDRRKLADPHIELQNKSRCQAASLSRDHPRRGHRHALARIGKINPRLRGFRDEDRRGQEVCFRGVGVLLGLVQLPLLS